MENGKVGHLQQYLCMTRQNKTAFFHHFPTKKHLSKSFFLMPKTVEDFIVFIYW